MNREEFIKLVSREQESLRRFLLALCCGNREEANDIAQETLVKAYLSVSHYKGYSIKEISVIIDVSVDAVKKQLSRGREQLKLKIKRE